MEHATTVLMHTKATTGNGTVAQLSGENRVLAVYVTWSPGSTAGAVTVETANDTDFTGTWAPVGSAITWGAANTTGLVQYTGPTRAVRARITSTVVGTVGVVATGGTTLTVVKAAAGWTIDQLIGQTVTMTGGTAGNIGLTRTITDNSATVLTVGVAFPFAVANLDAFTISGDVSVHLLAN